MGSDIILENFEDLQALPEDKGREIVEATQEEVFDLLKDEVRPEFLNRIDERIMFLPLSRKEIHQILELLLRKVRKMLLKQGIQLQVSEEALDILSERGYDPQFGARPMKRVLQKDVTNELSKYVISGEFGPGDTVFVHVDNKGDLEFGKRPFPGAQAEVKQPEAAAADKTGKAEKKTVKKEVENTADGGNGEKKAVDAQAMEDLRAKRLQDLEKATKDVMDAAEEVEKDQKSEEN